MEPLNSPDDRREEIKQLNDYARATFSQFATWWAFFVGKNLVAGTFLSGDETSKIYVLIAFIVCLLDAIGAGFCLIVSIRLLQIDDRITELAAGRSPAESELGNPSMSSAKCWGRLVRELLRRWLSQPNRTLTEYNSPVPLSFYLWCTIPSIFNCLLVALVWFLGIGHELDWWDVPWGK